MARRAPQAWLFLDEPTSALDLYYQQHLLRLLKWLTAGGQLHVCVVLHDLNLAALWADRILLLNRGNLVAQGTPQEVIQQPVIHRWYGADVRLAQHPDTPPLRFIWRRNPPARATGIRIAPRLRFLAIIACIILLRVIYI